MNKVKCKYFVDGFCKYYFTICFKCKKWKIFKKSLIYDFTY